jgi:hypothetical protein
MAKDSVCVARLRFVVRSGPDLRPGPRRQARWGGRGPGSRVGACAHRLGDATGGSALDAGGAAPDNPRRSGPVSWPFARDRRTRRDA